MIRCSRSTLSARGTRRRFGIQSVLVKLLALTLIVGASLGASSLTYAQSSSSQPFYIGAIPDQDVSVLNRRFGGVAEYIAAQTGLDVRYVPSVDYAALVTAFARGDIHLAWFGGLTGVQALAVNPGAEAIAQRPRDEEFRSVFIARANLDVNTLQDLKGLTFTFGSESSTSGHLMPRHFLMESDINPERHFRGVPNYSGSHDRTILLVESGAYQTGALNEAVWEARVADGSVDLSKVRLFYTTPSYYDYHWMIRGGVDDDFGAGTKEKVTQALLSMGPDQQALLDLFQTDKFIPTSNENYETIRSVARAVGIIR